MRALVRGVPDSIVAATAAEGTAAAIEPDRARAQHRAYVRALRAEGVEVIALPADERFPDGCFVEDTAVVARGHALVTPSANPQRAGEEGAVAEALAGAGLVVHRMADGVLDGGDVLRVGERFLVGRTARTDAAGARALARVFGPLGFEVVEVAVHSGLHLKCVCSAPRPELVLRAGLPPAAVLPAGVECLDVPADEAYAANAVGVGGAILVAAGHPGTAAALRGRGDRVVELDNGELRKADGSLTCLSILFP